MKISGAVPVLKSVLQPREKRRLSSLSADCDKSISERVLESSSATLIETNQHNDDLLPENIVYTHVEFLDEAFLHPEGLGGMKLDRLQVDVTTGSNSCENCSVIQR